MRAIAPRLRDTPEITVAEDQLEYEPITVAVVDQEGYPGMVTLVTRWQPTDEERARIFGGEDIYVGQLMGTSEKMTPLAVQVGPHGLET